MLKEFQHRRNETAIFTLARNVRKYRKARNMSMEQLANMMEVDYSKIGRIERGKVNSSISIIFDIATALNINPSQLLEL